MANPAHLSSMGRDRQCFTSSRVPFVLELLPEVNNQLNSVLQQNEEPKLLQRAGAPVAALSAILPPFPAVLQGTEEQMDCEGMKSLHKLLLHHALQ